MNIHIGRTAAIGMALIVLDWLYLALYRDSEHYHERFIFLLLNHCYLASGTLKSVERRLEGSATKAAFMAKTRFPWSDTKSHGGQHAIPLDPGQEEERPYGRSLSLTPPRYCNLRVDVLKIFVFGERIQANGEILRSGTNANPLFPRLTRLLILSHSRSHSAIHTINFMSNLRGFVYDGPVLSYVNGVPSISEARALAFLFIVSCCS